MNCRNCNSTRIVKVCAKCNDMASFQTECDKIYRSIDGNVPRDMGIGGGDYLKFSYCLHCGIIQSQFPIPETDLERVTE